MTAHNDDSIAEHEQNLDALREEREGADDDVSLDLPRLPVDRRDFMKAAGALAAWTVGPVAAAVLLVRWRGTLAAS